MDIQWEIKNWVPIPKYSGKSRSYYLNGSPRMRIENRELSIGQIREPTDQCSILDSQFSSERRLNNVPGGWMRVPKQALLIIIISLLVVASVSFAQQTP